MNKFRLSFVSGEWLIVETDKDLPLCKARGENCFDTTIVSGHHFSGKHSAWVDLTQVVYITKVD